MNFVGARRLVQGLPTALKVRDQGALVAGAETGCIARASPISGSAWTPFSLRWPR